MLHLLWRAFRTEGGASVLRKSSPICVSCFCMTESSCNVVHTSLNNDLQRCTLPASRFFSETKTCLFINQNSPDMPSCTFVQNVSSCSRMTLSSWCVFVVQANISPNIQHACLCAHPQEWTDACSVCSSVQTRICVPFMSMSLFSVTCYLERDEVYTL